MAKDVSAKKIVYVALSIALLYVSTLIRFYIATVPYTLQTLIVMLVGCFLGKKYGVLAVGVYIAMGLLGLPLFSNGGGLHYVFQPSFGYILAFLPGVYLIGAFRKKASKSVFVLAAMLFLVAFLMLLMGAAYYALIVKGLSGIALPEVLSSFVAVFLPAELVKAIAAAAAYFKLKRYSI